jgi:dihydrodipicolinate synthase/N-acetylneuraminate lyase
MALHGAIAAAATPLKDGGSRLDEEAFAPLVAFLAEGGVDGLLTCGTTGEGINLSVAERRRATELFVAARPDGFKIAVHAGAQTTHDTVALAGHAMETGADAVAVIAPPYYPLDEQELLAHFRAAASACAPVPFYVYEFIGRSGYAVPIPVIERLRTEAPNLRGLKVSDTPWSAVEPYLLAGLDVFVGLEPLVLEGMEAGGAGAVSGLGTAFPETVASLVHDRSGAAHDRVVSLREALQGIPFISAMKHLLARRGIIADPSVRAPLRGLTDAERGTVGTLL